MRPCIKYLWKKTEKIFHCEIGKLFRTQGNLKEVLYFTYTFIYTSIQVLTILIPRSKITRAFNDYMGKIFF